jgi:hypothetical protein
MQCRHDARVGHAEALDATDPKLLIQHCHLVVRSPHLTSTRCMVAGGGLLLNVRDPVFTFCISMVRQICTLVSVVL